MLHLDILFSVYEHETIDGCVICAISLFADVLEGGPLGPNTALTAVIKHSAWTAVIRVSLASCTVIVFVGVIRMRIESIWLSITESCPWSMSGGGGGSCGGRCGLARFGGGG